MGEKKTREVRSREMIVLDGAVLVGLAALITSVSALVWSVRRKA
jgi:hypothetical protein